MGETEAFLYLDEMRTFYLKGFADLKNMTMELDAIYWFEEDSFFNETEDSFHFVGKLDILNDGTILYAGSIEYKECTGFLFQGYLNLTQFDRISIDDDVASIDLPNC